MIEELRVKRLANKIIKEIGKYNKVIGTTINDERIEIRIDSVFHFDKIDIISIQIWLLKVQKLLKHSFTSYILDFDNDTIHELKH